MTKQLKLTSLLLLVTSLTFAQQNVISTTRSNVKDRVAVDTVKKTVTPTVTNQTYNKSKSNVVNNRPVALDSAKVTTTGQAMTTTNIIPGVGTVIKKNPGGGASRVGTTNDKGEVIFTIKEKGDYTITLVNDGGGAATNNNNAAAMSKGGGVKGVKVALGKNPGGSTNFATTNDKGEAVFKNLEVGNYKIVVQQADRATNTTKPAQN